MRNSSKLSFAAATLAVFLSAGSLEAQAGNDRGKPPTSDPRPTPTQPAGPTATSTSTSGAQAGASAGANAGAHNTTNVGVGQTTNVPVTVKPTTNVNVGPTSTTVPVTVNPTTNVGPTSQSTHVGPTSQTTTVGPNTQTVGPTTQTVGPTTQANTQTVGPTTQTNDQRQQTTTTTTTTQEVGQTNANQATGNVTSYNSNFKAGSATSMNTAANYVLKQCVSSVAINIFGGGVFGNYGGLGIAITPSGAIAIKDPNGDIFLVEDFADATPEERGKMAVNLSDRQVNLAGCLGAEWKRMQAKIAADLQMTQDSNLTNENIEIIRGNTLIRIEQIKAAAGLARPGVEHVCYRGVVIGGDGKPVSETLPLRGLGATGKVGHEYCEQVLADLINQINDAGQPMELRTRPDITAPRRQPTVRTVTPPAAAAGTPPAPSGSN